MLEDPSLSRQWVARRLQRALSLEYWGGAARRGLARGGSPLAGLMAEHATHSAARAADLTILIQDIGSSPYPGWGIGARLTAPLTRGIALTSSGLARRLARMLAEHTLSEYRNLEAFVEDAPGVAPEMRERVGPMHEQAGNELTALRSATGGDD